MVYIILGEGFEEIEAIAPCDILRRAGIPVQFAGIGGTQITGGHGIKVSADIPVSQIDPDQAEMVVIPGGTGGVARIKADETALKKIKEAYDRGLALAAICAGPTVLGMLGIVGGRKVVCYPGCAEDVTGGEIQAGQDVVIAPKLTTGRAAGAAIDFGLALVKVLRGEKAAEKAGKSICYDRKAF